MSLLADTAICLRCWDFSETSQTVSLLTREHGIIRGLAKGSRREGGMFSGGFDPLTRGHLLARLKVGRDLATLTEWQLERVWWSARSNLEVNRRAIYMADLVQRMITDHDPHPTVFDSLVEALDRMDAGHGEDWPLLRFQWAVLCETGYRPELDIDVETKDALNGDVTVFAFSSTQGGVVRTRVCRTACVCGGRRLKCFECCRRINPCRPLIHRRCTVQGNSLPTTFATSSARSRRRCVGCGLPDPAPILRACGPSPC